jgi:hypothetical protein
MEKTDLNHLTIKDLLAKADSAKDNYVKSQKEFYIILAYLDRTKRYKEDAQYKNASFDSFLRARYNMTSHTYSETRVVLFDYEDDAKKHGAGFVRKAIKKAGRQKAPQVFKEIEKLQAKRKRPVKLSEKEEVLKGFFTPTPQETRREAPRHDWEYAFKQEHRRAENLKATIEDLEDQKKVMMKANSKLTKENTKLKVDMKKMSKDLEDAQTMISILQEELDTKEKVIRSLRVPGNHIAPTGQGKRVNA